MEKSCIVHLSVQWVYHLKGFMPYKEYIFHIKVTLDSLKRMVEKDVKKEVTELISIDRYIHMVAEGAKRSPELIQLLELHTQFATITPYSQVSTEDLVKNDELA